MDVPPRRKAKHKKSSHTLPPDHKKKGQIISKKNFLKTGSRFSLRLASKYGLFAKGKISEAAMRLNCASAKTKALCNKDFEKVLGHHQNESARKSRRLDGVQVKMKKNVVQNLITSSTSSCSSALATPVSKSSPATKLSAGHNVARHSDTHYSSGQHSSTSTALSSLSMDEERMPSTSGSRMPSDDGIINELFTLHSNAIRNQHQRDYLRESKIVEWKSKYREYCKNSDFSVVLDYFHSNACEALQSEPSPHPVSSGPDLRDQNEDFQLNLCAEFTKPASNKTVPLLPDKENIPSRASISKESKCFRYETMADREEYLISLEKEVLGNASNVVFNVPHDDNLKREQPHDVDLSLDVTSLPEQCPPSHTQLPVRRFYCQKMF